MNNDIFQKHIFAYSIKLLSDNLDKNKDNQHILKLFKVLLTSDIRDIENILRDIDNYVIFDRTFIEKNLELGVLDILNNIVNVLQSNDKEVAIEKIKIVLNDYSIKY